MISFYDIIPGATTGIIKILVGYPFDSLKSKIQSNPNTSYYNEFNKVTKSKGYFYLYRGCAMPFNMAIVKRGLQLAIFEDLNKSYSSYYAGACSGAVTSIISNPMNIIKVQMQTKDEYKNTTDCIRKIYEKNGLSGFNKGFKINLIRDSLFAGSFLGTYGFFRNQLPNNSLSYSLCGALSSMATWSILIPFDTLRTIIQSSDNSNNLINDIKKKTIIIMAWINSDVIKNDSN